MDYPSERIVTNGSCAAESKSESPSYFLNSTISTGASLIASPEK